MGQPLTIINDTKIPIGVTWKPALLVEGSVVTEEYIIKGGDLVEHKAEPILYEVTITTLGLKTFQKKFNGGNRANWAFDGKEIRVLLLEGPKEPIPNEPQLFGVPVSNAAVQQILRGVQSLVDQGLVGQ